MSDAIDKIGKANFPRLTFEHGMNALNLAIDQESVDVVVFIKNYY